MKNEAYLDGQREAKRHLREIVVATSQKWWTERMEGYAHGHFSTKPAQAHFCAGWKSIPPPAFVEEEDVTLNVSLMNAFPVKEKELSPLEKEMYEVFHTYSSLARITFLSASAICMKYEIRSTVSGLNMPPIVQFLKQQLVSYKLTQPQENKRA